MFNLLLCFLSPALAGSISGWSVGLSAPTEPPAAYANAIVPWGTGYAVILDEQPTIWLWDGANGWEVLAEVSEEGVALSLAVYDGNLFVGGQLYNTHAVHGDGDPSALVPEYFSVAWVDFETSSAPDIIPVLGPCEGGNECGVAETLLAVEGQGQWDGVWVGGSGLVMDDLSVQLVAHIVANTTGGYSGSANAGLGSEWGGYPDLNAPRVPAVFALDLGLDPDPLAAPGTLTLVAVGDLLEDGAWGVGRLHLDAAGEPDTTWPTDLDGDGWITVEGGFPWEDRCAGDGSRGVGGGDTGALICVSSNVLSVAFFQGDLYVGGAFVAAWPDDSEVAVAVPALAVWDGSNWGTVDDQDEPVLAGSTGTYWDLVAGDLLYLISDQTLLTPRPSTGVVSWDGADVTSLQGGLHTLDGWGVFVGPEIRATTIDVDGSVLFGGEFTVAGWSNLTAEGPNTVASLRVARFDWAAVCPADLNSDELVNALDLAQLLAFWGTPGTGDIDGSGDVDAADLSALLAYWGDCP